MAADAASKWSRPAGGCSRHPTAGRVRDREMERNEFCTNVCVWEKKYSVVRAELLEKGTGSRYFDELGVALAYCAVDCCSP